MAWLSDSDVKEILDAWGVTIGSGAETGIAALAMRQAEAELGYRVVASAQTRYFDGPAPAREPVQITLPQPWKQVDTVTLGLVNGADGWEAEDGADYLQEIHVLPDGTAVVIGLSMIRGRPSGLRAVKVEGEEGVWDEGDVPLEIKQAAALLGAAYLSGTSTVANDISDIKSTTTGGVSITFGRSQSAATWNGLTARGQAAVNQAVAILGAYRIARVF